MRNLKLLVAGTTLAVLSTLLPTRSARADDDANNTGLELMVRPAYGSAGSASPVVFSPDPGVGFSGDPGKIWNQQSSPWGGGFVGDAQVGWRPIRFLSLGMTAGVRTASSSAPGDDSTELSRSAWRVGPYVRGYVPSIAGFEPWLSVGAEYMNDTQTYKHTISGINADWKLTHYGVAIPLTIGVDYRFLEYFGVGPSFQYAPVVPVAGCAAPTAPNVKTNSFCSTDDGAKLTKADGYGVWSVGLDLRVTLF
jgi:hypothetical protein